MSRRQSRHLTFSCRSGTLRHGEEPTLSTRWHGPRLPCPLRIHANPITNSQGLNTSAIFGFTNTLLTIIEKEKPTHLAVAFDTSAPTPRHTLYPAYKAQREAMPEELAAAIPEVKTICAAFHIPVLVIDGFEADDIIGTVARRAEDAGDTETFMVTPDKDFASSSTKTPRCGSPVGRVPITKC